MVSGPWLAATPPPAVPVPASVPEPAAAAAEAAPPTWMGALIAALAPRAQPHGGVDVGAILVDAPHAHRLRELLKQAARHGLRRAPSVPIAVQPAPGGRGLVLHLPPPVAHLFEQRPRALPPKLAQLMAAAQAHDFHRGCPAAVLPRFCLVCNPRHGQTAPTSVLQSVCNNFSDGKP